ncbi:MAG: terminase large subunit [Saprospiraceae bacterium]
MINNTLAEQYINHVTNGKIVCGLTTIQAVQRHLSDLGKAENDDFEYYFDRKRAVVACQAIRMMPHTSGSVAGKPFQLEGWQSFIVWSLYGWRKKVNKSSRFRKAYIKVPRKNGKTEFLAAIANLDLMFFPVDGGEMFWAATKKEQAKIGWHRQKNMINRLINRSKSVKKNFSTNVNKIVSKRSGMTSGSIGRDSKTEDGHLVYRGFVDEYHAHPDSSLVDILETGMGAFESPLLFIITTAGYNMASACKHLEDNYKDILSGQKSNDNIFIMIFDLDEGDDWEDSRNWAKANPSIGGALKESFLPYQFLKTKTEGAAAMLAFKVKHLNIWTNSEISWISIENWRKSAQMMQHVTKQSLLGKDCYGGLDLASVSDLTAFSLYFSLPNGESASLYWFWVPEKSAMQRAKKDNVKYLEWINQGVITATPGNGTDMAIVWRDISNICKTYNVKAIGCDAWSVREIEKLVDDDGFEEFYAVSQTMGSMSGPTKALEKEIINYRHQHFNNEVSTWNFQNVTLKIDHNENCKPDKDKSKEKIDGAVALVIAKAVQVSKKEQENVYEKRGIRLL